MIKVFLDANVVIDLLSRRQPFHTDVEQILNLSVRGDFQIVVSSLTLATTSYILSKKLSGADIKSVLKNFSLMSEISLVDKGIVAQALADEGFLDFEDGLQHYSAISSGCEIIITRDKKDFKNSKLPVMNPGQFLASIR